MPCRNKLFFSVIVICLLNLYGCDQYKVTDQVYFDLESEGVKLGRIVVGLFGEVVPKTVANFKQIASKGINGKTYNGSIFHRVVERFMIQGGDILNNDGSGSISIYGKHFDDENFVIKHGGPGIVSMANGGRNTNGCQFFITTMPASWLDGVHTAFGKVVKGQDIVHRIEHVKTDSDFHPLKDIVVVKSGLLKTRTPFYETDDPFEYLVNEKLDLLKNDDWEVPDYLSSDRTKRKRITGEKSQDKDNCRKTLEERDHNFAAVLFENALETGYEISFWAWIKAGWFPLSFSFAIMGFFHWIMLKLPE